MIQHIVHLRSVVSKNSHPVFAEGMWLGRDCIYFMTHPCSFLRSLSGMVEWFGFGNEANFETVVERMCYCWEEFTGCHRPISVPFPGEGTLLGYGRHGPAASDNFYLYPLSSTYQQYIFLHKLMSSSLSPEGRMKLQQQGYLQAPSVPWGKFRGKELGRSWCSASWSLKRRVCTTAVPSLCPSHGVISDAGAGRNLDEIQ